jgi:hypothetical protein
MMRRFAGFFVVFVIVSSPVQAATYFAAFARGGSPLQVMEIDDATEAANGWAPGTAPVPDSCNHCIVITKQQYDVNKAILAAPKQ